MADGNTLLRLNIEPVDSLFFRDARPFEPSSHAASGLPMPQTLAGAVRSVLLERHGVDFGRLGERTRSGASFAEALAEFGPAAASVAAVQIRGPWFTLNGDVLLPAPASLQREKASLQQEKESRKLVRLDPLRPPPPGWRPPASGMLPLWRYGQETVEAADGFLRLCDLARFLEGGWPKSDAPALAKNVLIPAKNVHEFEDRTGIGVDPLRNAAQEGHIYAVRMLVLKPEAGLSAELSGPDDALAPFAAEPVVMKFGGEGRHVVVSAEQRGFDWPHVPPVSGKGRLVLLTTPAWFNGWKPPALNPIAAAVGRHQAVSGWDLAKGGPKPNRFMVPAGSVYFLPPAAQVPAQLVTDEEDAKLGWGCFLKGNWSYV